MLSCGNVCPALEWKGNLEPWSPMAPPKAGKPLNLEPVNGDEKPLFNLTGVHENLPEPTNKLQDSLSEELLMRQEYWAEVYFYMSEMYFFRIEMKKTKKW